MNSGRYVVKIPKDTKILNEPLIIRGISCLVIDRKLFKGRSHLSVKIFQFVT
jgi:hypothetical protein